VKELLYHIVIPARMAAERLPGKPLAELAGRPLIEHVYRRARAASARSVVIATDDDRIRRVAEAFGADVVMTSDRHKSGSDRIAECARLMAWPDDTVIVNLQGDEPLMPAACLDQVARLLSEDPHAQMASLYWPLEQASQINDPNCVKVVVAADGAALLFSRSVIPYPRQWAGVQAGLDAGARWLRHIGLYAYRAGALQAFSQREPTPLECMEKLEQLRVLESGGRIRMAQACSFIPAGVDTPDDLERIRKHLARNGDGSRDTARQTG
jgi:3-deoxy-manno-octulosonate cytidylyltransferase (CMP-KDO synthetase)